MLEVRVPSPTLARKSRFISRAQITPLEKRIQESSQVPSRKWVASPISGFVSRAHFSPGGVYDIERRIVPKSTPLSSCTKNNSFLWCATGRSQGRRKNINLLYPCSFNQARSSSSPSSSRNAQPIIHFSSGVGMAYLTCALTNPAFWEPSSSLPIRRVVPRSNLLADSSFTPPREISQAWAGINWSSAWVAHRQYVARRLG